MSRVGKLPIEIPAGVTVSIDGNTVLVKGPKGELTKTFDDAVKFNKEDTTVSVQPANNSRFARAMYGTARAIIANMVGGVTKGYSKDLVISGVGFKAVLVGRMIDMNLGYSHPIHYNIPDGITVTIADNTKIKVEGIDKQVVGEVAATLKSYYPPEPYKGKGVAIVGQYIRRKEGKTAGK